MSASNKILAYFNKTITATIKILIQNGTGNRVQTTNKMNNNNKWVGNNKFQNWIQRDITGHMGTSSSTATQASLVQLGGKVTIKFQPIKTLWEGTHQIKAVNQINDSAG